MKTVAICGLVLMLVVAAMTAKVVTDAYHTCFVVQYPYEATDKVTGMRVKVHGPVRGAFRITRPVSVTVLKRTVTLEMVETREPYELVR